MLEEVRSGKKKGEMKDKGWTCDLIPKPYIVARNFAEQQAELDALKRSGHRCRPAHQAGRRTRRRGRRLRRTRQINKGEVTKRLKEIKGDPEYADEAKILKQWSQLD